MAKYAIVVTGSFGDILNTTPLAAHLKKVGHEVHWYIALYYHSALVGNTDVAQVFKIPAKNKPESTTPATNKAVKVAHESGEYAKVLSVAPYSREYWGKQKHYITTCIRKAAEHDLGIEEADWLVEWRPILNLTEQEEQNAKAFVDKLPKNKKIVLFEWQAESGQSHMKNHWIPKICAQFPGRTVVLSGRKPKFKLPPNAVDGSVLSIRETAELFNHTSFMIGVSSGLSCVCHSTWTKDRVIPWVESCNNLLWSGAKYPRKKVKVVTAPKLDNFLAEIRKKKSEKA